MSRSAACGPAGEGKETGEIARDGNRDVSRAGRRACILSGLKRCYATKSTLLDQRRTATGIQTGSEYFYHLFIYVFIYELQKI